MMFFFIAGVQPKTKRLEDRPRPCPACGRQEAYLKRINHYFSVFFIPLFRVKTGPAFLECERCGYITEKEAGFP